MTVKKAEWTWQKFDPVPVGKHKPGVVVTSLNQGQRRVLWEGIKALEPQTAYLIKNDTVFAEFKAAFNAELLIEMADFNRFVEAGQRKIEDRNHAQR